MSIVAGIFDTTAAAERAASAMHRIGIRADDLEQFTLNPPGRHDTTPIGGDEAADVHARDTHTGAVKGAAIGGAVGAVAGIAATPLVGPAAIAGGLATGAYVGSLAGAMHRTDDTPASVSPEQRPAGVMLAVHDADDTNRERVVAVLQENGARMIEEAQGRWVGGRWVDFDPVAPPHVIEQRAAPA
jgi:hypothetical protein